MKFLLLLFRIIAQSGTAVRIEQHFFGRMLRMLFLTFIIHNSSFIISYAQTCSTTATPSVLSVWNFDDWGNCTNGLPLAKDGVHKANLLGFTLYCPNISVGCGQSAMGSRGHWNTGSFAGGVCLYNFYHDMNIHAVESTFNPNHMDNLNAFYWYPAGKTGCLSSFSLKINQRQFGGTVNFEKQGVVVKRNGVIIYTAEQAILPSHINSGAMVFTFPNTPDFCADGSSLIKFEIVFGLVNRLVPAGDWGTPAQVGYDDIIINGTCASGSSPTPRASVQSPTCGPAGVLANGSIGISGHVTGATYDYNTGSTYTGTKTFATATALPAGGVIVTNLPNPSAATTYTVRVFGSGTCYKDLTVTLYPTFCPPPSDPCTSPAGMVLTATPATCNGTTSNNNGSIAVTGVTVGDKVGISTGTTYTGPSYTGTGIQSLTGGAYSFTGLANPTGSQFYTVRVYNGKNSCYIDKIVELEEEPCGACASACVTVAGVGSTNIEINTANNKACLSSCKGNGYIDLELTKTVNNATGTTCPTPTSFVWTVTVTNKGTITAKAIDVAEVLPANLLVKSVVASRGTFGATT